MNFVILDLEWNGTYSRRIKSFINEIIEFGAVKVDEQLHIIDTFEALVGRRWERRSAARSARSQALRMRISRAAYNICRSSAALKNGWATRSL